VTDKRLSIIGAGGKGGSAGGINEGPTTLKSIAFAQFVDLICEGEVEGLVNGMQSIYYDQVPLQNGDGSFNFNGVNVYFQAGTQGQSYLPGFEDVANEFTVNVKVFQASPIIRTITDTDVDEVRVTIGIPQLYIVNSDGSITGTAISLTIDVQSDGAGYVNVVNDTISGKSDVQVQKAYKIALTGSAPWDIRLTRLTSDNVTTTLANDLYWDTYDEIEDVKLGYPNSAVLGTTIDSSQFDEIPTRAYDMKLLRIQVPSNYDPVARTYTGVWDGTFQIAWSDNPAWCYYDLLTNSRYGLGRYIPATAVDKWSLYTIAQYCDGLVDNGTGGTEPRFTCNVYIQTLNEAYTVLQQMASIFRGMVFWAGGTITAAQDAPADPIYQYTAANVIGGVFSYAGASSSARHTVALVTWNNPNNFYAQDVQYVEDTAGISLYGVISTQVVAVGCTSQGQAERVGRWILYSERMESEICTWSTGLEGAVGRPGQIVQVLDPLRAGKRFGGRLLTNATNLVPSGTVGVTLVGVNSGSYEQFVSLFTYGSLAPNNFGRYEAMVSGLGPYLLNGTPDGLLVMAFLDGGLLPSANCSLSGSTLTLGGIAAPNYNQLVVLFSQGGTTAHFFRYEAAVSGNGPYALPQAPDGTVTMVFLDGRLIPSPNYSVSGVGVMLVGLTTSDYQHLIVVASYGSIVSGYERTESAVSGLGPYPIPYAPDGELAAVFLDGGLLPLLNFSVGGAILTLDAPAQMLAASTYTLSLITSNGGIATYPVAAVPSDGQYSTVILTLPLGELPKAGTIWILSGTEVVPQLFRIISVVESDKNIYQIQGVANNPSKYDSIDFGLAIVPRTVSINAALPAAPASMTLTESVAPSGSAYALQINASWATVLGVAGYIVSYFVDSDNPVQLPNVRVPYSSIPLGRIGTYTVQVQSINLQGKKSAPLVETAYFNGSTLVLQTPQGNSSSTTVGSIRSTWSGLTISYTTTGGPPVGATISVSAATLIAGSATTSYNASSLTLTGTPSTTVTYFLWYDDPGFKGGSLILNSDTTGLGLTTTDGVVYVGSVAITYPASGGSSGGGSGSGGGGACVSDECFLPLGLAADVECCTPILCVNETTLANETHAVVHAVRVPQLCVRVLTKSGITLTCSLDAPLRRIDGSYVYASEALGNVVTVMRGDDIHFEEVILVTPVGLRRIVGINAGDRCFWAGDIEGAYILHHNIKTLPESGGV